MDAKNQSSCDLLAIALEMEKKGKEFYQKAAKTCALEECKQVFNQLAEDEDVHIERINRIHGSLTGGQGWCEWDELGQARTGVGDMMQAAARKHGKKITAQTSDLEALEVAIGMEAEAAKFYKDKLSKTDDRLEREFLERMAMEERAHQLALTDFKFYLEDPGSWFQSKEKGHLDGG